MEGPRGRRVVAGIATVEPGSTLYRYARDQVLRRGEKQWKLKGPSGQDPEYLSTRNSRGIAQC